MYKETPLIKQYYNLKYKYPDCILFFQVGDFYEIFGYDAILCSKLLDLTLTKRNKKSIFLVGFPCNSLIVYINKLIKYGHKIAICDQEEYGKKGDNDLINRTVSNIISPGISLYDNINKTKNITKFVALLYFKKDNKYIGISFLDFSTGEFLTTEGEINYIKYLILSYNPKEFFIQKSKLFIFKNKIFNGSNFIITLLNDNLFNFGFAYKKILEHFSNIKYNYYLLSNMKYSLISSGLLIYYIKENYNLNLNHVKKIKIIEKNCFLLLDETTIKNLEIVSSLNKYGKSLFDILDKTSTSMGYRLLNNWIIFPLKNVKLIKLRQRIIKFFFKQNKNNNNLQSSILYNLKNIYDIEKLVSIISNRKIFPNQLYKLLISIKRINNVFNIINIKKYNYIFNFEKKSLIKLKKIYNKINKIIIKNPINQFNKGYYIKKKVSKKLDNYKKKLKKKKKKIYKYFLEYLKKKLNITYLNVNKNDLIGYYIEIKKKDIKKIPKDWIIKQKLSIYIRYTTNILNKYEYYVYFLKKKIFFLEKKIYNKLLNYLDNNIIYLKNISSFIAKIDVIFSLYLSAKINNYVKPKIFNNKKKNIKIIKGRHPVIEITIKKKYISNDIYLDNKKNQIIIITGPNMVGKSALLRQIALIVVMAQIGSYVPAEKAEINIIDSIFSRIGASDNISVGKSTFMIEMSETSNILKNFSSKSLIIMDEIGRGTSTYDGIALSYSIIKYINNSIFKPKLLFATHFHELKNLLYYRYGIKYYYLSIIRENNNIRFVRKLKPGISNNSYGIYIAQKAGIPNTIIKDSKEIFNSFNKKNYLFIFFYKIFLYFKRIKENIIDICMR
ncbi:MAG: DNA mismatch repair protein MutS [Candidatus Shikimatogenerans bostrichidophilus]|nr:MAG: DNA mismatch repair protein MutS [Candidatus Shikimatogenerans bostrichidophilus]